MARRQPHRHLAVAGAHEPLVIVPIRHHSRMVLSILVVATALAIGWSVVTNPRYEWGVVGQYFLSASVLRGVFNMIELVVVSMALSVVLGTALALMRLSNSFASRAAAAWYVWFFRGIPLMVQIIILYNISALYPDIRFTIPGLFDTGALNVNAVLTPWVVAIAGLTSHEAAHMCEIIRGGILSVDRGQREAAKAVGMSPWLINRRIVFPQAMRFIIPPTGNQFIALLKASSLVSIIAYPELLHSVTEIYSRTYQTIPLLIVATIWYLVVTTVLMVLQSFLEQRFARGAAARRGGQRRTVDVPADQAGLAVTVRP